MVWRQCPNYYPTSIGAGINVFLGVSCGDAGEQLEKLAGRALSTVDAATPEISGPGVVGWHLPDEADVSVGDPAKLPNPRASGRVTFLTLTDKFSVHAAPGPYGKAMYPELFARADVIGFDTYPIEVRCSVEQIDNVFWMQRELIQLTGGKPTFQWIEAGPMEHCRWNQDPTPGIVRAETWLAIAGGAKGIGYFPDYWEEDIRSEVTRDEPRDPRARPRPARPVREGELVDAEPGAGRRTALQRRDLRRRREHLDGPRQHLVHHPGSRRTQAARLPRGPRRHAARRPRGRQAPGPRRRGLRRAAARLVVPSLSRGRPRRRSLDPASERAPSAQ